MTDRKLEQARWVFDYLHKRAWRYEVKTSWLILTALLWINRLTADPPELNCATILWGVATMLGLLALGCFGYVLCVPKRRALVSPARTFFDMVHKGETDNKFYQTLTHGEDTTAITSMDDHLTICAKWFHWALMLGAGSLVFGIAWFLVS